MARLNMNVPPARYCETEAQATQLLQRFMNKVEQDPDDFIGCDTETHGKKIPLKPKSDGAPSKNDPLDWMQDTVTFWSLAAHFERGERWALPQSLLWKFIPLLENKKANIVGWNFKYDMHVLYNSGIYVASSNCMDGLAMANLVDENNQGGLGLKEVSGKKDPFFHPSQTYDPWNDLKWADILREGRITPWTAIPMTKFTEIFPKEDSLGRKIVEFEYSIFDLFREWPDRVIDYASLDAWSTLLLCEHLRDIMICLVIDTGEGEENSNMWEYFCDMEVPITKILWRMERRGIQVNEEYLQTLIGPMGEELLEIEKQIFGLCGWPVNLNSTPQLRQLFFGEPTDARPGLGLEPVKMTKGGSSLPQASTDKDVLDRLASEGVEIASLLKRHREVQKTKSTYVEACLKLCKHHLDGRIHPEFKQFGARTGRFSSKVPNAQNMPRPDHDEFGIRKAFTAPPEKKLIVRDYGQLEMRILAHFSQDEGMIVAIRNGLDLHCFAVEKMYNVPYADVSAAKKRSGDVKYDELSGFEKDCLLKRQTCKNTGFAIVYGAGAPRISSMLEIPIEDAEDILELYFEAFPGVKTFMEDTIQFCQMTQYVLTLVGRRRRLKDIDSHVWMKRTHAEREATNAPIQGSAADIVKAAMINIAEDEECKRLGVEIVNQIHDELVMECPEETAEEADKRISYLMELPFAGEAALCVATPTDGKIVDCWAEAK